MWERRGGHIDDPVIGAGDLSEEERERRRRWRFEVDDRRELRGTAPGKLTRLELEVARTEQAPPMSPEEALRYASWITDEERGWYGAAPRLAAGSGLHVLPQPERPALVAARTRAGATRPADAERKALLEEALALVRGDGEGTPLSREAMTIARGMLGDGAGEVRVHVSARANEAARLLGASAFTLGKHIYFADGELAPGTPEGDRLLRHELAHVRQHQRGELTEGAHSELLSESASAEIEARAAETAEWAAVRAPERRIPHATLERMERAYAQRFDDVELHLDSGEVQAGAKAFARGRHIYFEPGALDLEAGRGEEVLAHELAHVVQQSQAASATEEIERDALEDEAHDAAAAVMSGGVVEVELAASAEVELGYSQGGRPARASAPSRAPSGAPSRRAPSAAPARAATPAAPSPASSPSAASAASAPSSTPSSTRARSTAPASAPLPASSAPPSSAPRPTAPPAPAASPAAPRGPAGDGLLLREAPSTLSSAATSRLHAIDGGNQQVATATTTLPTAPEQTAVARAAVEEPQTEQDAHAQHDLVSEVDDRPPPSPEIEEACERIRQVIRDKRPPDEDSLVDAKPREMAQEAGAQMSAGVEERAGTVREGYSDMQRDPEGSPSTQPVPPTLPPERAEVPEVTASAGAPDPLPAEDVSLEEDVEAQRRRIEDAGMNTEAGRLVEDGPIGAARDGVGDLESMAQQDPQQVLADQAAAIAEAQGDMRALQAAAERMLAEARTGAVGQMRTHTTGVKGGEEQQRAAAGRQMQDVFTAVQNNVNQLLQPLSGNAVARWEGGINQLSTAFESELADVARQIEERHSGAFGGLRSLGDSVFGLPDWVVERYDRAEAAFADGATSLITDISRDVNAVIEDCQKLIEQARKDIEAIVQSLPASLQDWAKGEADRLNGQLDQLSERVTSTQQQLNQDLIDRANGAVQSVRERVAELREAARGLIGRIADAISQFLENPAKFIIDGLLRMVGIPPASFWAMINRLGDVIDGIADDPKGFANTLMAGVGQGFQQFFDNLPMNLGQSLFQWLFSKMGEAGVAMPADFSMRSILTLVLEIMGITWTRIRAILARHVGERNVELIEQAVTLVQALIERGPQGVFDLIAEQLDPSMIIDAIKDAALQFVMEAIITRVAARILMMLNPVGAILQAIEAVYRVIKWVIENAARIFSLIEAVVNGAAEIVAGNTSGVAALVESSLVRLMVPVIDFLADYLGFGGLPEAIKNVVLGLQARVEQVLDRVIGFLVTRARAALAALRGGRGENERAGEQPDDERTSDDGEIGEHLQFTAGHERHTLWVETGGGQPVVMMASTPKSMDAHLAEMRQRRDRAAASNPGIHGQTDGLFGQVETATANVERLALVAKGHPVDSAERATADQQVEAAEAALRGPLVELLQLLGVEIPKEIDPPVLVAFRYHSKMRSQSHTPTVAETLAGFTRADFFSQVKSQERGLNAMTVGEWQQRRDLYTERGEDGESGRDPIGDRLQAIFRSEQRQLIIDMLEAPQGMASADGVRPACLRFVERSFAAHASFRESGFPEANAAAIVDDWLDTQAALHDPDQIAGGSPSGLTDLGNRRINSSIGSQWGNRCVAELDQGVHTKLQEIPQPLWHGIGLRVTLDVN